MKKILLPLCFLSLLVTKAFGSEIICNHDSVVGIPEVPVVNSYVLSENNGVYNFTASSKYKYGTDAPAVYFELNNLRCATKGMLASCLPGERNSFVKMLKIENIKSLLWLGGRDTTEIDEYVFTYHDPYASNGNSSSRVVRFETRQCEVHI